MTMIVGLIAYGVLAVILAFVFLVQRHFANKAAQWPDDNARDDDAARRNVLRVLTMALVAFAIVSAVLSTMHGGALLFLPLAAIALIAIAAIRLRMRAPSVGDGDERSQW